MTLVSQFYLVNQTPTLYNLTLILRLMRHFFKNILQGLFSVYVYLSLVLIPGVNGIPLSLFETVQCVWLGVWRVMKGDWRFITEVSGGPCVMMAGHRPTRRSSAGSWASGSTHTCNIKIFDLIAGVFIGWFVKAVVLMQVRGECVTSAVWNGDRSYSLGWCQVHRKRAQRHTLHPEGLAQTRLYSQPRRSHCVQPPALQTWSAHQ